MCKFPMSPQLLFLTVCWLSTVRLSVAESKRLPITDPSSPLMDAADSVLFHRQQSTWNVDSDTQKMPTLKNNLVINDNNPMSANDFSSVTEMEGGGGLNVFGVTSSFVNPGTLLSSAMASGIHQFSEIVNSIGNMNRQQHSESPLSSVSIHSGPQPPRPAATQQFFGISEGGNHESVPSSHLPSFAKNVTSLTQFFGIANIYIDGMNSSNAGPMNCSACPSNPYIGCPAPPQHIILTVTACYVNTTAIGACSATSTAESGTLFVLYPTGVVVSDNGRRITSLSFKKKKKKNQRLLFSGFATIGIMVSDLNPKISVTCPHISAGTTVTTNGPVLPNQIREETGFVQLIISGAESLEKVAVACEWRSSI